MKGGPNLIWFNFLIFKITIFTIDWHHMNLVFSTYVLIMKIL
jgi:hypothetical protein